MRRFLWIFILLCASGCQTVEQIMADAMATPIPPTATPTLIPPTPTTSPNSVVGFERFLEEVEAQSLTDRMWPTSAWLSNEPQSPLIDGDGDGRTAVIFYEGRGNSVALRGDMNGWGNAAGDTPFERVVGTNFWWIRGEYEPNARLDYRIVVDGVEQLDKYNPQTVESGFGLNSVLIMPEYVRVDVGGAAERGKLNNHIIESVVLSQTRSIVVYEPPFTVVGQPLRTVYVHDGGDYLSFGKMKETLDALITAKEIVPMVAVFMPPVDRQIEYVNNPAYRQFVASEILPFVQETYNTSPLPEHTGTLGASLGGLVALEIGLEYSDLFGVVASQSAAFSLNDSAIVKKVSEGDARPLKLHLIVGTYETAVYPDEDGNFLQANRGTADALREKGYDYAYIEYPEGHSWGLWAAHVGDALRYLYK